MTTDIATAVLIGLAGATLYLTAHHASFWLARRGETLHGWVALWGGAALLQQLGRLAHYGATSDAGAVRALKLSMAAIILCGAVAPYAIRAFCGVRGPSWALQVFGALNLVMLYLCLGTDFLFSSDVHPYTDAAGRAFLWVDPGPGVHLWIPWGMPILGYAIWLVRRNPLSSTERVVLTVTALIYVTLGVSDTLVAIGAIEQVLTFDYSFAIVVFGFAWIASHRFEKLHGGLEIEVAARTEQLELALGEVRAASAAKERFFASITHEIRTPLHGLQATTQLLAEGAEEGEQGRLAGIAVRSTAELRRLLDDLLDTSALRAGQLAFHIAPLDGTSLARELLTEWRARADAEDLALHLEVPDHPCPMLADELRLRQVLGNLVGNAIKFTESGSVTVQITDDADTWRFTVKDTGPGIAPESQRSIFEAFQQQPETRGGTGLGLTIARHLVDGMGGVLTLESALGEGTALSFALPACAQASLSGSSIAPTTGSGVVLVVDDNPTNREVARVALQRLGVTVEEAQDGYGAVARTLLGGLDLVLMDLNMPGLNGVGATERIRSSVSAAGKVPIVAMTAAVDPAELARCREAGMEEVLTKPLDLAALRQVVTRFVDTTGRGPSEGSSDQSLLPMFIEDASRRLKEVGPQSDSQELRAVGHAIRGAAASIGLDRTAELCRELERSPGSAELSALHSEIAALERPSG